MDKSLTTYNFTAQEHVSSAKLNGILALMEEHRLISGPMSISVCESGTGSDTKMFLELDDSPYIVGGTTNEYIGDWTTRATFTVIYATGDGFGNTEYARWEDIIFVSGDSNMNNCWYAQIGTMGNTTYGILASGDIGTGNVNLSTTNISGFTCFRQPVSASGVDIIG